MKDKVIYVFKNKKDFDIFVKKHIKGIIPEYAIKRAWNAYLGDLGVLFEKNIPKSYSKTIYFKSKDKYKDIPIEFYAGKKTNI